MNKQDLKYLNMTIDLARKAEGKTCPNPLVGAVLVKSNKVIAVGYHKRCGGPHAEINAIKMAGIKAKGATIYVNLEPCSHFGRTPPCTQAIIKAGIKRVVIGMKDPHRVNNGKGIKELRKAGIKAELAKNPKPFIELNEIFVKYITQKMPFVIIKAGQSLDGKIATRTGKSKWITGKDAREHGQMLRSKSGAIIVGINTVLEDNPYLSCRYRGKLEKDRPVKVIIDSQLRVSLKANIFSKKLSPAPVIIATTKKVSKQKIRKLENGGAAVWICPSNKENKVDLKFLMRELSKREISSVLVEGGGTLNGAFFDAGLVDKACFFIAPKVIGGKDAVSSVGGMGIDSLQKAINLDNIKVIKLKKDILIEGKVNVHRNR
ncbi:MAG: bifunctional diaminohydroxyphosphoribosylaminopyrimidine deaminase/5-amino-6-(5-phosphoribosylamino)uracil reductase RibD [PVC group bacterium]|nr:bifunctional diaminohydroxyphosphoribosylaminopyrimidine deaminase/5-amino-6-(5-phosphoribosylamino)uracil reductase RibD [PVC group bacterium]